MVCYFNHKSAGFGIPIYPDFEWGGSRGGTPALWWGGIRCVTGTCRGATVEPESSLVAATTFSWFRGVPSTFSSCNRLLNGETHANHETGYVMANESNGAPWSGKRPATQFGPRLRGLLKQPILIFFTAPTQFTNKLATCLPTVRHGAVPCPAPVRITPQECLDPCCSNFISWGLIINLNVSPGVRNGKHQGQREVGGVAPRPCHIYGRRRSSARYQQRRLLQPRRCRCTVVGSDRSEPSGDHSRRYRGRGRDPLQGSTSRARE